MCTASAAAPDAPRTKTAPATCATGMGRSSQQCVQVTSGWHCGLMVNVCLNVLRRQMLFCRVTLGKSFLQFSAMKMAHAPPGHHSVIGRPSVNGLAYAEYVIYRGEQVSVHSFVINILKVPYK